MLAKRGAVSSFLHNCLCCGLDLIPIPLVCILLLVNLQHLGVWIIIAVWHAIRSQMGSLTVM